MPAPRPKLHTSTLWYHPSQQFGDERHGNPAYPGRTPVHVIHNLLERYTRAGDLVVDPFCGGGTTVDVAHSLAREVRGFDIGPSRPDVEEADARALPLEDESVDFVFMDPPYSTHIEYSGKEECIGRLDAFEPEYFEAMAQVFHEAFRVLRDRRYLAVYVSDSFKKKRGFVPIGTHFMVMLSELMRPIDHIAVVRGNRKLESERFNRVALEQNYYQRGFNHLLIFKKEQQEETPAAEPKARARKQTGSRRKAAGGQQQRGPGRKPAR